MTGMMRIWILLVLMLSVLVAYAQIETPKVDEMKPGKLKRYGLQAYDFGDYISTVDYLGAYYQEDSENAKVNNALAEAYLKTRNYAEAETMLKQVTTNDENNIDAWYNYGLVLKSNGKYDEAKEAFLKFRKLAKDKGAYDDLRMKAVFDMKGVELAPVLIDSLPLNVDIKHLNSTINKAHMEGSPMYMDDSTLLFTSLRTDTSIFMRLNDDTSKIPVRKLYLAALVNNDWKYLAEMPGPFNNDEVNTTNGAFSPDKKRFYFSRCDMNARNEMICALYVSKRQGGKWQEPEKLGSNVNNPKYSNTQPTIGLETRPNRPDREILYFASNNEDSRGGWDIWYTIYDPTSDVYSDPRNLGGRINSKGDDMTPYYDQRTNTLYYSSDGKPGLGGMDVFKAVGQRSQFTQPENVGFPINSGADDVYYITHPEEKKGFFVSNREGSVTMKNKTCCDDIYAYEFRDQVEILLAGELFEYEGEFNQDSLKNMSSDGLTGIVGADISVFVVDEEDGETLIPMKTIQTNLGGSYALKLEGGKHYKVFISKDKYFGKEIDIPTAHITASTTIKKKSITTKIPSKPIVLENIYYEFNSARLTENARNSIDTTLLLLLNDNPNMIIEIMSHTDSKGSDSYNLTLSRNRAKSVVEYLIEKGISIKRLQAKGYGETQPVAPNENPDGSDNPEGRAKNRRTEFQVLGQLEIEDED